MKKLLIGLMLISSMQVKANQGYDSDESIELKVVSLEHGKHTTIIREKNNNLKACEDALNKYLEHLSINKIEVVKVEKCTVEMREALFVSDVHDWGNHYSQKNGPSVLSTQAEVEFITL